jgi:phospholipase D1/2
LGSLSSALVIYGLGRVLRRDVITRMTGSYMEDVSRALAHKGILSLFVLHVFPICPFSMLNLLAGATHIRLKDYVAGTLLGMTPGIVLVCFFGGRLLEIIKHPQWVDILSFIVFVLIGVWAFWALRRRLLRVIGE